MRRVYAVVVGLVVVLAVGCGGGDGGNPGEKQLPAKRIPAKPQTAGKRQ